MKKILIALIITLSFSVQALAQANSVGPRGASFWDTLPRGIPENAERGDIYWIHERDDAPSNARAWNVIYVSEGASGKLEYVSGEIYVPRIPSRSERKVLIWATGTTGTQDSCAPSRNELYRLDGSSRVPSIETFLARGYVVVMSDYQGSGTPGATAYLQGAQQAMASFDIARAARNLPEAMVGTDVGIYGFSQGGQTALWAAHIVEEYAPEFNLVGAVPLAPASRHLELSFYDLDIPVNSGYFIMRMAGLQVGHPELKLGDILTDVGLEQLTAQSWGCYEIFGSAAQLSEPYAKPEALEPGTAWRDWLEVNDEFLPISTSIPVLMIQGVEDVDVPYWLSREVLDDMCEQGNNVNYIEMEGADHFGVFYPGGILATDWFDARFAGETMQNNSCD
ncbi:MAG: lipase family protein [Gammaproteobacteria bacterium]|jgi:pimeloyl-ACP methyl ester carboxylesterase|nr:lipase family protein [Gammaproteobacteria bacterium]